MMKNTLFLVVLFASFSFGCFAQDRTMSPFYYQRVSLFEQLPINSKDIVFLGNSLTNGCEWNELFDNPRIKNRGISGDVTMGVYNRLDPILKGKPAKIFLLTGINDVSWGMPADSIVDNMAMIVKKIKSESPRTKIYLQSVLPFDDDKGMYKRLVGRFHVATEINELLIKLAAEEQIQFINLYPHFLDKTTGKLDRKYSNDGLHLLGNGYLLWRDLVKPYVNEK